MDAATKGIKKSEVYGEDLTQLQKRILGLEMKIKQDNEGMIRLRQERNESVKGILKKNSVEKKNKKET